MTDEPDSGFVATEFEVDGIAVGDFVAVPVTPLAGGLFFAGEEIELGVEAFGGERDRWGVRECCGFVAVVGGMDGSLDNVLGVIVGEGTDDEGAGGEKATGLKQVAAMKRGSRYRVSSSE